MASGRHKPLLAGGVVLSYTDISSQTSEPSGATDGSALVDNPTEDLGVRKAAPNRLDLRFKFGSEAATASATIWFFVPEDDSGSGVWYPSALIELAENSTTAIGGNLRPQCPRNASRVYLQVSDLSAGTLHAGIDGDTE